MIDKLKEVAKGAKKLFALANSYSNKFDEIQVSIGALHSELVIAKKNYRSLAELELKVFSQFGDDGIIQFLTHNLAIKSKTFIEFGVEDYYESNTRFLMQKDNWSGFVMDGSDVNINRLKSAQFFWRYDLAAQAIFITTENISGLLEPYITKWGGLGLLHIDLDGNDYWIWKKLTVRPEIVILEYNSYFGIDRPITVPYDPSFYRGNAHYSNLYWGASLKALYDLSISKGYAFVGCNSAGNNAYFIQEELLNDTVRKVSLEEGFVRSKFRESRDAAGNLSYLSGDDRTAAIRGLTVLNTDTQQQEKF